MSRAYDLYLFAQPDEPATPQGASAIPLDGDWFQPGVPFVDSRGVHWLLAEDHDEYRRRSLVPADGVLVSPVPKGYRGSPVGWG